MRPIASLSSLLTASALVLAGCGSGGSSTPVTNHVVTLSWAANREAGVNKAGGGYRISISGQAPIDVPYVSGPSAPTSRDVTLSTGSYTVTVSAYAALDAQGGATGSVSAPSQAIAVNVP